MTDRGWEVARIDEIPRAGQRWIPIRKHFDIGAFGVNAWAGDEAGGDIIGEHDEEGGHEELYYVSSGRATFTVGGEEIDAPAGTLVFVEPPTSRKAVAAEDGTMILSFGAKPGEAYEVGGWEANAEMFPLYEAGDYAGAAAILHAAIERGAEPGMYYNLACVEALRGNKEEALEAIEHIRDQPRLTEMAAKDSDFDSIRDDPRFTELLTART